MNFFIIISLVLAIIIPMISLLRSHSLRNNFKKLGNMTGLKKGEIIKQVGQPNSISTMPDGILLQWQADGYHIAIAFDHNDNFIGITHEFSM